MPGAVTKDLIDVSTADASTGWVGTSGGTDTESKKQGTGSWTYQTPKNGVGNGNFTPAANINMTANYATPHLYWVMRCDVFPFTEALNTGATASGLMLKVSDGAGNYVQWHVTGSDKWDGSWRNFIFDLTNTANIHSSSGTLSLADVALIEWVTDNSNSGTIRIIDNTWLDAVRYGDGLSTYSLTTEAYGFADIGLIDVGLNGGTGENDNYYQVIQEKDGVLFAQGKLEIGRATQTTNFVSIGETVYFLDRIVSSSHHSILGVPGTATDVDIQGLVMKTVGSTGAELDFSNASLSSFSMIGSTLIDMGAISFGLGTIDTTGFSGCGTTAVANCAVAGCSWSLSDAITITGTGTVTGSDMDNCIASSSVLCSDLADVTGNSFVSDGSNHAVELSSLGAGTMTWDNQLSGYVAGITGSPVAGSSTGNEALYVNVGSGTITINVADGATTPSIRTAGATVNVIAGQKTVSFEILNGITGYEWRLYEDSGVDGELGTTELAGEETAISSIQSPAYTYSYTVDTDVILQIIDDNYEEHLEYFTLVNSNISIDITLTVEENI